MKVSELQKQTPRTLAIKVHQRELRIEYLENRISELEKQMKGYQTTTKHYREKSEQQIWTSCLDCGQRVTGDSIHTCSPQLKTLTDEEILREAYYILMREQQRKAQEK
jgi:hypothetical protein